MSNIDRNSARIRSAWQSFVGAQRAANSVVVGVVLVAALGARHADAREWYRYVNDRGVVVLDQSVPPEHVDKGYSVLDDSGRVVRVIPSTVDRLRLEEQGRVRKAEQAVADARVRADQDLMRMYSSPEDIERARDRKLSSIDAAISVAEANLERLRAQKKSFEEQGARLERSGRIVTDALVENVRLVEAQIKERRQEITARRIEKEKVRKEYERNIQRVKELYGYSEPSGV